jgi:hypothetical protein
MLGAVDVRTHTRFKSHTSSANFCHASVNLVSSIFKISSYISRSASPSASVKGLPSEGLMGGVSDREGVLGFGKGLATLEAVVCAIEPLESALVRFARGCSRTGPEAVGDDVISGRG